MDPITDAAAAAAIAASAFSAITRGEEVGGQDVPILYCRCWVNHKARHRRHEKILAAQIDAGRMREVMFPIFPPLAFLWRAQRDFSRKAAVNFQGFDNVHR